MRKSGSRCPRCSISSCSSFSQYDSAVLGVQMRMPCRDSPIANRLLQSSGKRTAVIQIPDVQKRFHTVRLKIPGERFDPRFVFRVMTQENIEGHARLQIL